MNIPDNTIALVTKKFNDFYYVDILDDYIPINQRRFLCKSRKSIKFKNNHIYVGDKVYISKINTLNKTAIIESLLKRKNFLDRPSVANISDIYITYSVLEPKLNFSQVSKFLLNAELMDVEVSLILTKCDLINEKSRISLVDKFARWGYIPKTLNLKNELDFYDFFSELKTKKCSILMGPSGVGKTTLLNKIIPNLDRKTAKVSSKIKKGKNTTRNIELFYLSNGSYIVDTPGFNLHTITIAHNHIQFLFPEIFNQLKISSKKCKFRDCLHINEPGCIIDKTFDRYRYYKELINESKFQNCQSQED